jgi:hypothetical protein
MYLAGCVIVEVSQRDEYRLIFGRIVGIATDSSVY